MGIKGKQNASSIEPQENEIFLKYEFPILHKQDTNLVVLIKYESRYPKRSPDRTILSK